MRYYTMLLLVFVGASFAFAQCCPVLEKLIIDSEKATWEVYKTQDVEKLDSLLTENAYEVDEAGTILEKADLLKELPEFVIKDYSMSDMKVIPLTKEVAVIRYKITLAFPTYVGQPMVVSSVWVRCEDKGWKNAVYHATYIHTKVTAVETPVEKPAVPVQQP